MPENVLQMFVGIAHSVVKKTRYEELWELAIGLFIAHHSVLFLKTSEPEGTSKERILSTSESKGLQSSKSAGSLSVSYDLSSFSSDFAGWGSYKETEFGKQFITLSKMAFAGGFYVL